MPEVILKKFIVSILIGVGCLCGGIIGMYMYHDTRLFMLSIIIFICVLIKDGMMYYRLNKNNYTKIVGKVLSVNRQFFSPNKNIVVKTEEGTVKLYIPNDVKIRTENTYCFYFLEETSKSHVVVKNNILAKSNADNFIGCELMKNISEEEVEKRKIVPKR